MQSGGISDLKIKQIMEQGKVAWNGPEQENTPLPHQIENNWFYPDHGRNEAEKLLKGLPNGTFLIRKRKPHNNFALSITYNGEIKHCIIDHTEKGYGFAEPFNIYDSLTTLVIHYANNSLEEHNDVLQTTLKHPIRCQIEQTSGQSQLNNLNISSPSSSLNRRT
jgi:phosphoinositide-3-kinase regulatory subunit alpha/beta/delta